MLSARCGGVHHLVALATCFLRSAAGRPCPNPTAGFASGGHSDQATIFFTNSAGVDILVQWVDDGGKEGNAPHPVQVGREETVHTYLGHAFRVYQAGGPLVLEYKATSSEARVDVGVCDTLIKGEDRFVSKRAAEFESLVHNQTAPCVPAGQSAKWSCIRYSTAEEYRRRPQDGYGFQGKKEAGHRAVGATEDNGYVGHISKMPRVTRSKGFLKLSFTQRLKEVLIPFYAETRKGGSREAEKTHDPIAGGYTNIHTHPMSKINLDDFRDVQTAVYHEMKEYLQWWTGQELAHTATFGVRIYHQGSMLINHVDRADTHVASAVIQIGQESADVDGGWPLEVIDDQGNCGEVFLQPGELVLYEGARFKHGRPMQFKGERFANIFSHFRPLDWRGPGNSPQYNGIDGDGFVPGRRYTVHDDL